jgi:hypothetical protein
MSLGVVPGSNQALLEVMSYVESVMIYKTIPNLGENVTCYHFSDYYKCRESTVTHTNNELLLPGHFSSDGSDGYDGKNYG